MRFERFVVKEKQHESRESHESKSAATFVRFGKFVVKDKQYESRESHEL